MKICIVLGTRPEIIKMSPLIRYCKENNVDHFIIHTGQHYSYNMDKIFFEELELDAPKYNLNSGSSEFRKQIGLMSVRIKEILVKEKPDFVLVQGDTNTVLAGALAANQLHISIAHIEAGLRSHELEMIEETNRIVVDHISNIRFPPTKGSKEYLLEEKIPLNRIFLSGNTVVDAVIQNLALSERKTNLLEKINLKKDKYFLITLHRPENVDKKQKLDILMQSLKKVSEKYDYDLVWPLHPRTKKMLEKFNLKIPEKIKVIEPVGYLGFLQLESNARLIITDSGGVQEEASILKVPCITMRDTTERQETVDIGCNVVAGVGNNNLIKHVKDMLKNERNWESPYGDGKSSEFIIKKLKELHLKNDKLSDVSLQHSPKNNLLIIFLLLFSNLLSVFSIWILLVFFS
jgi:UDP-N-acetylglucosamine 2-epimerase (non-hydrolysing)